MLAPFFVLINLSVPCLTRLDQHKFLFTYLNANRVKEKVSEPRDCAGQEEQGKVDTCRYND